MPGHPKWFLVNYGKNPCPFWSWCFTPTFPKFVLFLLVHVPVGRVREESYVIPENQTGSRVTPGSMANDIDWDFRLLAWWFEDFNKCFSQKTTIKLDKTVKDWKWPKACNKPRSIYLWKLSLFRWKQQVYAVPACGCSKLPTSVGVVFNQSRAGPQARGFAAAARGAHLMWSIVSQSGNLGGKWLRRASVSASLRLWSFSRANSGG